MDLKPTFNIRLIMQVISSNLNYILDITRELNDNPEKIIRSSFIWLVDKKQLKTYGDIQVRKPKDRGKIAYEIFYRGNRNEIEMGERDLQIEVDCRITESYFSQFKKRIQREKLSHILPTDFIDGDIMIEAIKVVGDNPPSYKIFGTSKEILD